MFDPHEVTVEPGAWADEIGRDTIAVLPLAQAARPGRHEDPVAAWLADHPGAAAREIADGTGISWPSVYVALDALERAGRVTRERAGRGRGGGKVAMRFTLAEVPAEPAETGAASLSRSRATRAVAACWMAAAARSVPGSVQAMSSPASRTQLSSCAGV